MNKDNDIVNDDVKVYDPCSDLLRHSPEETRPVLGDLFAVETQRAQVLVHAALERSVAGLLQLRVR